MSSIFFYTQFVQSNSIQSKKDLKLHERMYCILNDVTELPVCKYCGNTVKFISLKNGYAKSCAICIGDTYREKIGYPTLNEIKKRIDTKKYEILQFPKKTETDKLIIRCKKCNEISEHYIYNGRGKNISDLQLCKNCEKYSSNEELELRKFISSAVDSKILSNVHSIIPPYELDIVVPEKKIAIEFDGLYWHNDSKIDNKYHLRKTKLCEEKGIQLIHIFEDEWLFKQDIVKSRLKNLLGIYDKTVYARKCEVREVPSKESRAFQEANHLQGAINSKVSLGLYYENELVSLMTFGKCRFDKKHEWEMLRFCNKLNCHIVGAAGKLLVYFEKNFKPSSLVSYADRRWSQGKLYQKLGFTLSNIS